MSDLNFFKQLITPAIAAQYLDANKNNRRVKEPVVLRYAEDMKSGRWKADTAEVIKISINGNILDGQHRLKAVIKAGTSINFHVAVGLKDDVFDVLDTGSTRNASDSFKIAGIKNSNSIPSIINTYYTLKKGLSTSGQKNNRLGNSELLMKYYEREEFFQMVDRKVFHWYTAFATILKPSTIGGFYCFFHDINSERANDFMNQLTTGKDIKHIAINMLRDKLMKDKMSSRKMPQPLKYALIIKAWNYFRENKDLRILKFDVERENFPIAI